MTRPIEAGMSFKRFVTCCVCVCKELTGLVWFEDNS
jgi:hypothetical protein